MTALFIIVTTRATAGLRHFFQELVYFFQTPSSVLRNYKNLKKKILYNIQRNAIE